MKLKHIIITLILAVFMYGCTADNSDPEVSSGSSGTENNSTENVSDTDNTVDTNGTVSISFVNGIFTKEITINKEVVTVEVLVFDEDNSPYNEGNISIAYPEKVKTGIDVGSFAAQTVAINNGRAVFTYTAPSNLQERVDDDDSNSVFGFYLDTDSSIGEEFTFNYVPASNQIELTDYTLEQTLSTESYTMGLESSVDMSFGVKEADTELADSDITSIKVVLLNPALAEIKDKFNNSGDELNFTTNNVSMNFFSNTISGIVPIEVTAVFVDNNGDSQTLVEVFNMTIFSGPPTAMSINYGWTAHDADNAKFQDTMIITVTDKYFNPVNTAPAVSSYLIAGYALENSADLNSRMLFSTSDAESATMNPTDNTLTSTADFSNVDIYNDILLTYGNGYKYNASGKWDISSINGGELTLVDEMGGTSNVSDMGFAIGHNYRQDTCQDDVGEKIGFVTLESDRLDSNGMVKAVINYDSYLTGKNVVLAIDTIGYTANGDITSKFGESVVHTLRSTGFIATSCDIPVSAVAYPCTIAIEITDTKEWYRNARAGYDLVLSDGISATRVSGLEDDIHDCAASTGVYYVNFSVNNSSADATGTLTLDNISVASEF